MPRAGALGLALATACQAGGASGDADGSSSTSAGTESSGESDTGESCQPEAFVPAGAIAFWDFEDDGETIVDRTGNGHDGVLDGPTAALAEGRFCSGFFSDGTDGVVVPDDDAFDLVDGYTLEMWVRLPVEVTSPCLHKSSTFTLRASHDLNQGYVQHEPCVKSIGAALDPDLERWHHVAGTWDGSTFLYYIDAQELSQQLCSQPPVLNELPVWIGQGFAPSMLDDVAIFAGARTAEQICVDSRGEWDGAGCSWAP